MKTRQILILAVALYGLFTVVDAAFAQGTAFTYEGQLSASGSPANGNYDFTFALFSTNSTNTGQVGSTLTNFAVCVTNGLFTVLLDFGSNFPGASRWLAISVRTNGSTNFTALNPLQELTPTPYAIYAPNAGSAASARSVAATNITGAIPLAQLPAGLVTNTETGVTVNGTFSGNGGGLTNLNASSLTGTAANLSVGNITVNSNLCLPATTSTNGIIYIGGAPMMHAYGYLNYFAGNGAGNFTMSGNRNVGIGNSALAANTSGTWNTAIGGFALGYNTTGYYDTAVGFESLFNNTSGFGNTALGMTALAANSSGNNNAALGWGALGFNTTGSDNTASGRGALNFNTTGIQNTASGSGALVNNTTGSNNTASGFQALQSNTNGYGNSAIGYEALFNNTSGYYNTANGFQALYSNTTGYQSVANGDGALFANTTGIQNTANGSEALANNTTGSYNAANGVAALQQNTTGIYNTANGFFALQANTTGLENAANGGYALASNTSGSGNTANGSGALENNTTGGDNAANGFQALQLNTTGNNNTANGYWALYSNTMGSNNIAEGYQAGYNITTGSSNIDIGNTGVATDTNIIRIGTSQAQAFIAGQIVGDGSGLTNLNVGQLPSAVLTNNETGVTLGGTFIGDGSQLGNLNADQLSSGTIADTLLPSNVALTSASQTFEGQNVFQANVGIGNSNPTNKLMVVNARCDGSSWINASDRNLKQDFAAVDAQAVLGKVASLPVRTWSYKLQPGQKHLGPVAQDFHPAFGLGLDDVSISTVDEGGVALAAIQGLNQKLNEKDAEIEKLKAKADKVDSLEKQLNELKLMVQLLAEKK